MDGEDSRGAEVLLFARVFDRQTLRQFQDSTVEASVFHKDLSTVEYGVLSCLAR